MSQQINKKWFPLIIGLVILLLLGTIQTGVGQTAPDPTCGTAIHQCGAGTCILGFGSCQSDLTVTFNPPLLKTPTVVMARLNNTSPQTLSAKTIFTLAPDSLTFQAMPSNSWVNFPSAKTELYGQTNQRLGWNNFNNTNSGILQGLTADWCVTVVTTAPFGGQLRVEYSTNNGGTWNTFGDASFFIDVSVGGFQCVEENSPTQIPLLAGGFYWWRVVGLNGADVDTPAFGTIQLSLLVNKFVLSGAVCYATVEKNLLSSTQMRIAALCPAGVTQAVATAFFVWEVWV